MFLEWLRRNQNVMVPLGLLLTSLTLLSYKSYRQRNQRMSVFSHALVDTISFGQRTVTGAMRGGRDLGRHYLWLLAVEQENQKLRKQLRELRRKNYRLNEQALENERLRRLLHFKPTEKIKNWIAAQVIGEGTPSGINKTITINKGSRDGIKPRMAVITYDSALVGQILDEPGSGIGLFSSHVLLITDRRSRVTVINQRSRTRGIISCQPESDTCGLLPVERLADIKVGDLLVSSGYGRVFRKGWPAARVTQVVMDPASLSPRIRVEPVADFSRLEEVMVIVPPGPEP